ncbi:MAG: hypothetical protein ACJ8AO_15430 [Gemmatimonadaceae bacterium]
MRHLIRTTAGTALVLAPALAVLGAPAAAQVTTVDEGSFSITRAGDRVGSEVFAIKQTPGAERGMIYVSSATITTGDRRVVPALRTDERGAPLAYRLEVRVNGAPRERLTGLVGGGRFSAQIHTASGESASEIVVSDGARLVDEDIFHQYYFVALGNRRGPVPVIVPRRGEQVTVEVVERGREAVVVGGRSLPATRLTLMLGGVAERSVWVDAAGRVLKVEIPSRQVIALRDEPPR